jgi:hypothetical protein
MDALDTTCPSWIITVADKPWESVHPDSCGNEQPEKTEERCFSWFVEDLTKRDQMWEPDPSPETIPFQSPQDPESSQSIMWMIQAFGKVVEGTPGKSSGHR